MALVVALLLAFFVLSPPWTYVAVGVGAAVELAESWFWWRLSRRGRPKVGVETLVGRRATVVRPLTPRGQVKLDGEVWEARADFDLLPGDEVVIRGVDGLLLDVEPAK